jgi:hypothetical protein
MIDVRVACHGKEWIIAVSDSWMSSYLDVLDRKTDAELALNAFFRSQERALALPGDQEALAKFLRLRNEVRSWSERAEALLLDDEPSYEAARTARSVGKDL